MFSSETTSHEFHLNITRDICRYRVQGNAHDDYL